MSGTARPDLTRPKRRAIALHGDRVVGRPDIQRSDVHPNSRDANACSGAVASQSQSVSRVRGPLASLVLLVLFVLVRRLLVVTLN